MSVLLLLLVLIPRIISAGILYPRESDTRDLITLDGLWTFALDSGELGRGDRWYQKQLSDVPNLELEFMPVPASYNDISVDESVRDYVGAVWYQRDFFVPQAWSDRLVWIRFGSVCYSAEVWINGEIAVSHSIGHLPFQAEVSRLLNFDKTNLITVLVNNTLTPVSIPQGDVITLDSGRIKQTYTYDFFHYAGIDRSVLLYTTSDTYVDDITIDTRIDGTTGLIDYQISVEGSQDHFLMVFLEDADGKSVAGDIVAESTLQVENAKLWWPYLMDPDPGYLYKLQVTLINPSGDVVDSYTLPIGIRTVTWTNTSLLINDRPVYLRGIDRHEDSDITGKGYDPSLVLRDYNLIKWLGVNSFRTSHYPYADEIMDLADQLGIMVIDESPAVNTENFSPELLENHKRSISEMIQRDKNRPAVIMWSAANEPRTQYPESEDYYREVIAHLKSLDRSRPVTVVNNQVPDVDYSAQFTDIASFNLYSGWYKNAGDLDIVTSTVIAEIRKWHDKHNIPVMITEYGGDTQEGLHTLPTYIWSEDYQSEMLSRHFQAFDIARKEGFFIGELIWNLADFKTWQRIRRVGGNKKGIFTRNRQPKASAYLLRKRYWQLAQDLDGVDLPGDINPYVIRKIKDEL